MIRVKCESEVNLISIENRMDGEKYISYIKERMLVDFGVEVGKYYAPEKDEEKSFTGKRDELKFDSPKFSLFGQHKNPPLDFYKMELLIIKPDDWLKLKQDLKEALLYSNANDLAKKSIMTCIDRFENKSD